jgi:hypothetical protein
MKKGILLLIGVLWGLTFSFVFLLPHCKDVKTPLQITPVSTQAFNSTVSSQSMNIDAHENYADGNNSGADTARKNMTGAAVTANIGTGEISVKANRQLDGDRFGDSDSNTVGGHTVKQGLLILYINDSEATYTNFNSNNNSSPTISTTYSFAWNTSYTIKIILACYYDNWSAHFHYKGTASGTIKFTDDEKPTGTLSGVTNGGVTNGNVSFSWTDQYSAAAKLNGSNYTSGTTISTAANHTIRLTDQAGNYTDYTFTIDKTAPVLSLSGVSNGGFTSGNVTVTFGTQTVAAGSYGKSHTGDTLTGKYSYTTTTAFPTNAATTFTSGTVFSTAGHYKLQIADKAGNSSAYTFTIDKTAPTLSLSGVTNGGFTNGNVTVTFITTVNGIANGTGKCISADTITAKYSVATGTAMPTASATAFSSSQVFSSVGHYRLQITDAAGNSSIYTFTIDRTAPTLSLSGVSNGGFTNSNVTVTFVTAVNGIADGTGKCISADTITAKYSVATGTTMPTGSATAFTSGQVFTAAGHYRVEIIDSAGNSSVYTFTVDKTAPTLSLSGVDNEGFTNGTVTTTFTAAVNGVENGTGKNKDNDTITTKYSIITTGMARPTASDIVFSSGQVFSAVGHYRLQITDAAGNISVYYFSIDKTAPALTLSGVANGGFTNGTVTAAFVTTVGGIESNAGKCYSTDAITAKYSVATEISIPTSSNTVFSSGQTFSAVGHYRLQITDAAGNSNIYTFTIDRTAPTLTLSGVDNEGFTNGTVTTAFTVAVNGIDDGTGRNKDDDTITAKYSVATGTSMPTGSVTAFSSGQTFTAAGHYRLEIADSAGNSSTYTFTIDRTAPIISLLGVTNNGFTNGTVTVSYNTVVNGIDNGAGKCYPTDIITAQYTMDIIVMPSSAYTGFASNTIFADAGHYRLQITDAAGNSSVYTFTIDRIAPIATLDGGTDGGAGNSNVTVNWGTAAGGVTSTALSRAEDTLTGYYTNSISGLPESADTQFVRSTAFSSEGWYLICIYDSAGNSTVYSFVIDKTKPQNNLIKEYTNQDILFSPTANLLNIVAVYVKYGGGVWAANQSMADSNGYNVSFNGMAVTVYNNNTNGDWWFKAMDTAGNVSDEQCVVMDLQTTFKNRSIIYDSYKANYWYNMVLPTNVFGVSGRDISGTYHAGSYETALNFAIAKEWEYRVSVVPTGYMYVSSSNGNLAQLYTNRAELDIVVEKYAKTYIRDRSIAKNGTNNFAGIIADDLTINQSALTRQHLTIPDFLGIDSPVYFIDDEYKFADPNYRSASFVKVQMVASDIGMVSRAEVQLSYDVKTSLQIFASGNNGQGYYLVTEWDIAGNFEQYYVYIDLSAPTLTASATYGNNTTETVIFDENLIENYNGSLRYIYLDLQGIADSMDNFVTIVINGRKMSNLSFVQGDELPLLDGLEYYGNYTIEIFDRSGNVLQFTVAISGAAPYMTNTSLSSDTNCKLTLNIPDTVNTIIQIKLYHILYDGTYEEMLADHSGTTVSTDTLQYVIAVGGKYTIWYVDLFGRSIECTPVFYLKGLPTAMLSGVTDGGITNRNVSLRYDAGNTLILYKISGGTKEEIQVDDMIYASIYDEIYQRYTVTLTANADTSASYIFFLYNNNDMGLFVEYTFAIDCIIAPVYIYNQDGTPTAIKNTYTNKPFYFQWNETVTLRYYTSTTPGGDLGSVRYTMNTVLTANGLYYFTLQDSVGNKEEFTILLDTVVSYKLEGDYITLAPNSFISKSDLKFTITEATAVAVFKATPEIVNGGMLGAGNYAISITDAYGNSIEISIVIDKTPPVITLIGVTQGGVTSGSVTVTVTDYQNIYRVNNTNQILTNVTSGDEFTAEGQYKIMAADFIGNSIIVVFTIDKSVLYTSSIANSAITTKAVTFNFNETIYRQNVTLDGTDSTVLTRYTAAGKYIITAADMLGNELEFVFTILPGKVRAVDITGLDDYTVISVTNNNRACSYAITDSRLYIADTGTYSVTLKNTTENIEFNFNIEVDSVISMTADIVHKGIKTDPVSISFGETVTQTVTRDGTTISNASRYSVSGNYKITAADALGNELVFEFTILPARVREIALDNLTGIELISAAKDGEPCTAEITDEQLNITGRGVYSFDMWVIDTQQPFSFNITVDDFVDFTSNIPTGAVTTDSVSFVFFETMANTEVYRDSVKIRTADSYSAVGRYTVSLTDDLDNQTEFAFEILPNRVRAVNITGLNNFEIAAALHENEPMDIAITDGNLYAVARGHYLFTMKDVKTSLQWTFDIEVDDFVNYTGSIPNNAFTTNAVSLAFAETVTQTVTRGGETIKTAGTYSGVGEYVIHATDDLGNELYFNFIILPPKLRQIILDNLAGIEIVAAVKDGEPYTAEIAADQLLITDGGQYSFTMRDVKTSLQWTFDIEVDTKFSLWASVPNGAITTGTVSITFGEIVATQTIKLNGSTIKPATSFSAVGQYIATFTDVLGNEIEYIFTIAPESVRVIDFTFFGNFEVVSVLHGSEPVDIVITNGNLYAAARGQYTFAIKDRDTEQEYEFDITVDDFVDFTSNIPTGAVTTDTVSLVFAETIIQKEVYKDGIKSKWVDSYSAIGCYSVSLTDDLGNQTEFVFEILPVRVRAVNITGFDNFEMISSVKDDIETPIAITDGNLLVTERGHYTFAVNDKITFQQWTFNIEVDDFVNFASNIPAGAVTTDTVSLFFAETITQKTAYKNGEVVKYADSYSAVGRYSVHLTDDLGNQTEFVFEILPIKLKTLDIKDFNGFEILSVYKDGTLTPFVIINGNLYAAARGHYLFTMRDVKTSLQWTFNIEVDDIVNFTSNIPSGAVTTNAVSFVFLETVTDKQVYKDGTKAKWADSYSAVGRYTVLLTDDLGNETEFVFEILPIKVGKIDITGLDNFDIVNVLKDGVTFDTVISNGNLLVQNKGYYMFTMVKDGIVFSFNIEIENTKPTADIEIESGEFVVKKITASVPNVTATLTKDGKEVSSYNIEKRVKGAGNYILVLTDELGNTNTYEFTVKDPPNWATWAAIGGFAGLGAIVVCFVLQAKRRLKVR